MSLNPAVPDAEKTSSKDLLDLKTVINHLGALKSTSPTNLERVCQEICTPSSVSSLQHHLDASFLLDTDVVTLIAELSKSGYGRQSLGFLLPSLVILVKNSEFAPKTIRQIYRAIGNLCYENDAARQLVLDNGGIPVLLDTLRTILQDHSIPERDLMVNTAVGCVNNVSNDHDVCQEALLNSGYLNVLADILSDESLPSCHRSAVEQLNVLADTSMETRQQIAHLPVASGLVSFLKTGDSEDYLEDIVDLLSTMLISDNAVGELTKRDCLEILVGVIEKESTMESVLASAGNILVELTARESLQDGPDSEFLVAEASLWLAGIKDKAWLRTVAALVIGNLSRSEAACQRNYGLKPDGKRTIPEVLLCILGETVNSPSASKSSCGNDQPEVDPVLQLQYALLSAVKNLCTPEQVRRMVLPYAVFPLVKVMDSFDQRDISKHEVPVVAKLLALTRMFISTAPASDQSPTPRSFDDGQLAKFSFKYGTTSGLVEEPLKLLCAMVKSAESRYRLVETLVNAGLISFVNHLLISDLQSRVGAIVFLSMLLEKDNVASLLKRELLESDFFKNLLETAVMPLLKPDVQRIILLLLQKLAADQDLKARIKEIDLSFLLDSCREYSSNPEMCSLVEELTLELES
ncbi:hypothetical protein RvY_01262 [Ramazzottius varieornatus]|uniref:Uncharacterized protein n=1 Tax=Ramazzottius varieornatus TaxID=947166 RepID=A0A1D1UFN6_RAMVA|nr:hypothetical protein RvY_01262 [Ramazzottius varieornatus]